MKKIIIIISIFICSCMPCLASEPLTPEQNEADQILGQFVEIEKNKAEFLVKSINLGDESRTVSWSKKGVIRKIILFTKNILGTSEDHYYFSEQQLILCRSIMNNFKLDSSGKLTDKSETQKHYLLYHNGELILPSAMGNNNQTYIKLGIEKRSLLITNLAKLFV